MLCLESVSGVTAVMGRKWEHQKPTKGGMAVSSRSLGSGVDKDRDFCTVVIQLMPPSVGVVSLMKTLTSRGWWPRDAATPGHNGLVSSNQQKGRLSCWALIRRKDIREEFVIENILDQVPSRHLSALNHKEVSLTLTFSEGEFREIKGISHRNQMS